MLPLGANSAANEAMFSELVFELAIFFNGTSQRNLPASD
jgi:hypothetical protein